MNQAESAFVKLLEVLTFGIDPDSPRHEEIATAVEEIESLYVTLEQRISQQKAILERLEAHLERYAR